MLYWCVGGVWLVFPLCLGCVLDVLLSGGIVVFWLCVGGVLVAFWCCSRCVLLVLFGGVFVVHYCVLVVCWCRVGHVLVFSCWCGSCGGWVSINQSINQSER